jgi:hypothetical protein
MVVLLEGVEALKALRLWLMGGAENVISFV